MHYRPITHTLTSFTINFVCRTSEGQEEDVILLQPIEITSHRLEDRETPEPHNNRRSDRNTDPENEYGQIQGAPRKSFLKRLFYYKLVATDR